MMSKYLDKIKINQLIILNNILGYYSIIIILIYKFFYSNKIHDKKQ